MPQVGDRVIVAGQKLGAPTREGTLLAKIGSMIRVRWADGTESLFTPGAGSVEYQAQGKAAAGRKAAPNGKAPKSGGKAGGRSGKSGAKSGAKASAKAAKKAAKSSNGKAPKASPRASAKPAKKSAAKKKRSR